MGEKVVRARLGVYPFRSCSIGEDSILWPHVTVEEARNEVE